MEVPETAPLRYDRTTPELIAIPKSKDELSTANVEQEQPQENHAEGRQEALQRAPMITEEEGEPSKLETVVASKPDRQATRRGNPDPAQEETQRVEITLDSEIVETIRQIAQEQRELRAEFRDTRQELFEIRVLVKTHESRLNRAFGLAGDVIDGQRALCAGIDELMKLQETTAARGQVSTPTQDPIESEPVSSNVDAGPEVPPERLVVTVPGAESLYVLENNRPERRVLVTQNQERGNLAERSKANVRQQEAVEALGEARIWSKRENRLELKTDKALERWRTASDTSCEW